jgi:hypothetical protein
MNAIIERPRNSENLGASRCGMELWIKRYGSVSFQGQNSIFRSFWGSFGIFGVVGGSFSQKTGFLRNLGIFGDFCGFFGYLEWFGTYL